MIRHFDKEDMPMLGELYQAVMRNKDALFWWVGDEDNWENVYCAFEHGRMIAKGQVAVINVVPPGRSTACKHSIYLNLKTVPEREGDTVLLDRVYSHLFARSLALKKSLSTEYGTLLCMGNDAGEEVNTRYFTDKGYRPLHSLFCMSRDLHEPIPEPAPVPEFDYSCWRMESAREEREYLQIEAEIWPDTPLGLERLREYKGKDLWTSLVIRQEDRIVAGLMAWREGDEGTIEDVFVREPWRKRGLAKVLLAQGLLYLKAHGLSRANLMVATANASALSLYVSLGFRATKEERRYGVDLE
ncbi:GNAT family N-acetyltransferase [Paenibacillus sp. alder61]|uniref:GNAT family N-acetyltransferase n=1 Tax=Paenibacillus sp. alder61 TaxID=2862948 RepID=UPI001CD48079|nr:GNAT family N-acetyltransferase [Paenibacillus sp. alder61]MCA1294343.1 GNAT family N-acetyltransferase [Paenibacillus sp. alder61]